jgi:hypothetical protein
MRDKFLRDVPLPYNSYIADFFGMFSLCVQMHHIRRIVGSFCTFSMCVQIVHMCHIRGNVLRNVLVYRTFGKDGSCGIVQ